MANKIFTRNNMWSSAFRSASGEQQIHWLNRVKHGVSWAFRASASGQKKKDPYKYSAKAPEKIVAFFAVLASYEELLKLFKAKKDDLLGKICCTTNSIISLCIFGSILKRTFKETESA